MCGKGRTALDAPNTPHPAKVYRIRAAWLLALVACLGPGGCQAWDEVTSRDFTVKEMFSHPDPMWVLNNTQDGDKRPRRSVRSKNHYARRHPAGLHAW